MAIEDGDRILALLQEVTEMASERTDRLRAEVKERMLSLFEEHGIPRATFPDRIWDFRRELGRETDRGLVLYATSHLESELASLLQAFMIDDPGVFKAMLSGNGSLSTFSSRIDAAYMLGLISTLTRRDLHLLRKVRNVFAHSDQAVSLSDESVASRLTELTHDVFRQTDLPPRARMMRVTLGVAGAIQAARLSIESGHHPRCSRCEDPAILGPQEALSERTVALLSALRGLLNQEEVESVPGDA